MANMRQEFAVMFCHTRGVPDRSNFQVLYGTFDENERAIASLRGAGWQLVGRNWSSDGDPEDTIESVLSRGWV